MCKQFTTVCSEGNSMTGPMLIDQVKSFCSEMKIIDKCTLSWGWLWSLKETAAEGVFQMEYFSDKLCSPSIGAVTINYM